MALSANEMVEKLFDIYLEDLNKADSKQTIFTEFIERFPDSYLRENADTRIVADYIAGMTDQYFLKQYDSRVLPRKIDYDQLATVRLA